jgi:hypothetical protein
MRHGLVRVPQQLGLGLLRDDRHAAGMCPPVVRLCTVSQRDAGQAAVLLVGALLAVLAGGVVLGGLAR